jgi:hypothetical protein
MSGPKTGVTALGLPALYLDNGKRVTTHSMLKAYLQCPKTAQYKYAERLKPKMVTRRDQPLKRGTWVHELFEVHYDNSTDETWQQRHAKLTTKFNRLMDEEKEALGDLPIECARLMRSYLWHYGADKSDPHHGWKVLGTEVTFEVPWPDSEDGNDIYRCRVDLLVEDAYGFLIVDHKTHKQIPDHTSRTLDAASPLYIWAARANGYPVRGFAWNYIRTKAATEPKMAYVGTARERLSQAAIDTDYPTYATAINRLSKVHDFDWRTDPAIVAKLRHLKSQRWKPGAPQTSPFFQREILEKDDDMLVRVVATAMKTRDRMHQDFDDFDITERNTGRACSWCPHKDLCTAEMYGGQADIIRRKQFTVGDPLSYYNDEREPSTD